MPLLTFLLSTMGFLSNYVTNVTLWMINWGLPSGLLRGFRLAFTHRGGFGNVVPFGGRGGEGPQFEQFEGVHGVLHRLPCAELADLTNMEHEYRPVEVEVEAYDGCVCVCVCGCVCAVALIAAFVSHFLLLFRHAFCFQFTLRFLLNFLP
jgi:hypothetical protein